MTSVASHTFVDYLDQNIPAGWIVPQAVYVTNTAGFEPRSSIRFTVDGQLGFRLADAAAQNFDLLDENSTNVVLNENGMKIALRILWPGYAMWSKHVNVYNHARDRVPISKGRLAQLIAQAVREYLTEMADQSSHESSSDWWLSEMAFEDLILLELRHVSPGSWQPVLCRSA